MRRAALSACGRLLRQWPLNAPLCGLWVRAALPLLRDAESGVCDEAVRQVQEGLLVPLATAGGSSASAQGKGGNGEVFEGKERGGVVEFCACTLKTCNV